MEECPCPSKTICPYFKNVRVLPEKLTQDPYLFRTLTCDSCNTSDYRLLLIPPSWDKSEHQSIISRVWAKAVDEIRQATRLCIIGYSMPEADVFFQYLLTRALSRNEHLYKLVVVDKVDTDDFDTHPPSSIETRYRQLLDPMFQKRRFSFYSDGVEHFFTQGNALGLMGRGELVAGTL